MKKQEAVRRRRNKTVTALGRSGKERLNELGSFSLGKGGKKKKREKTKAESHNNLPVASRLLRQQSIVLCVHSGRKRRNNLTWSKESLSLDIKKKKKRNFSLEQIPEKLQDFSLETSTEMLNKRQCGGERWNCSCLNASARSR